MCTHGNIIMESLVQLMYTINKEKRSGIYSVSVNDAIMTISPGGRKRDKGRKEYVLVQGVHKNRNKI
jgi:hypothetical protein